MKNSARMATMAGAIILLAGLAPAAWGGSIRVEVSGTFAATCPGCYGTPLEDLLGTPFTAAFVFPETGTDALPANPNSGRYNFAPGETGFEFISPVPAFARTAPDVVSVFVASCDEDCYLGREAVLVEAVFGDFRFDLTLSGHLAFTEDFILADDSLPSVAVLQSLVVVPPAFSVSTPDFLAYVDTYGVQPSLSVAAVPLPGALWLFAPALLSLAGLRRR